MPKKQTAYSPDVQHFIQTFFNSPSGKSPEVLKAKLIHWMTLANDPASADVRRRARQNAIRLVKRHPFLIGAYKAHQATHQANGGAK